MSQVASKEEGFDMTDEEISWFGKYLSRDVIEIYFKLQPAFKHLQQSLPALLEGSLASILAGGWPATSSVLSSLLASYVLPFLLISTCSSLEEFLVVSPLVWGLLQQG